MRDWRERKRQEKMQDGYVETDDDIRRRHQDRVRAQRWRDRKKTDHLLSEQNITLLEFDDVCVHVGGHKLGTEATWPGT